MGKNNFGRCFWFKGNKCNQKWTEEKVENILQETYKYVKTRTSKNDVVLLVDIWIYLSETHGVGQTTLKSWVNKIHIKNKRIVSLWELINDLVELSTIKTDKLRPNIQALVLQNKHDWREKKQEDINAKITEMPTIKIGKKAYKPRLGK